jgi:DNA polymerase IV
MGSYRRDVQDSGDIESPIIQPGTSTDKTRTTIVDRLVPLLTKHKSLVAALA